MAAVNIQSKIFFLLGIGFRVRNNFSMTTYQNVRINVSFFAVAVHRGSVVLAATLFTIIRVRVGLVLWLVLCNDVIGVNCMQCLTGILLYMCLSY